jgi:hypothetical protein
MEGELKDEFALFERRLWQLLNQVLVPMAFNAIGKNGVDES